MYSVSFKQGGCPTPSKTGAGNVLVGKMPQGKRPGLKRPGGCPSPDDDNDEVNSTIQRQLVCLCLPSNDAQLLALLALPLTKPQ